MKWLKFIIVCFVTVIFSGCNPLNKNSKSGLQVITDGVASAVFLNEQYIEKAPFINREIKPGEYTLKIQPDDPNLVAYETRIRLRPGLLTVVTWKLAERPELSGGVIYEMEPIKSNSKSEVSFITIPDGAIVSLQGKEKEFSPVIIPDITPGHNEFEVSLPSYESQKHTINAVPGYRMLVSVKLAKVGIGETQKNENNSDKTDTKEVSAIDQASESATATKSGQLDNATNASEESKTTGKQILIKPTNFFQDGKEVLRVRDKAGSVGAELGFASVGTKYPYLEKTENSWFNINFNGKSGWVSGTFAQIVE
ncbi:MAG: hypothetical protein COZ34_04220 [Candidatus Pacebacteria bacterium CG_4_10_14_3_um_filter_34_15]|nr:SH3 domain-containing protein [Candidatus Pacearchaeota archaeon]NCQ65841.1 SH3 domain-containing protein [Candidatus Paceibacterota bacterium]OIO44454.1 MAG: hypothetical protein AUJ41_02965 [Candidatus Pacebacteria bacterium CG1_02_43_31]PIQ80628.1 MAG: hypothetical protein COV78_04445 [Candidatus Pacebacteria bacterium CG11_big_fil_rev_8_21_14_0_20_34_55]PIX81249.1 MAG: hypothetical protein COZ34_04220 [Candidatus Pacebacteria bacterium CG_4_10_14_3_um_filter_34_15]PJC43979.1 MAG: hypoth